MSHHTNKHREDKTSLLTTHVSGGQLMLVHLDVGETVTCGVRTVLLTSTMSTSALLDFKVA